MRSIATAITVIKGLKQRIMSSFLENRTIDMKKKLTATQVAEQLKCPSGQQGVLIGQQMFTSNRGMIYESIAYLPFKENEQVLEIGFGNGEHLNYLFSKYPSMDYYGIETSQVMINEARIRENNRISEQKITLLKTSCCYLSELNELRFHHCFSVNTTYFWTEPLALLKQIHRILHENGTITLALISKESAQKQSFTDCSFRLYTPNELEQLLLNADFENPKIDWFEEEVFNKMNEKINRSYWIIQANKR